MRRLWEAYMGAPWTRDGTVRAPFAVPVESYTAPIAKLFVTVEPRAASNRPTGPTVMESA